MAPRPHNARVKARRCAVQALYQWLLADQPPKEIVKEFIAERELINVDTEYFCQLTEAIPDNHEALLTLITPHLDRSWDQIDPVEKCVLLVGAFELTSKPDIPWKVVINEAVSLCKMFGSEDAHKYVNGILDKVAQYGQRENLLGAVVPIKA